MKLQNASITFLATQEGTTIKIRDNDASITFAEIILTNDHLASMLSRLSNTPCEVQVFELNKVGKHHECRDFIFEMPAIAHGKAKEIAIERCKSKMEIEGLTEWEPDDYFGSQNSFFFKGGISYARTTIRRWVYKTEVKP